MENIDEFDGSDAANPIVPIILGGQPRQLYFSRWAFRMARLLGGEDLFERIAKGFSLDDWLVLLWAGLLKHSPRLGGAAGSTRKDWEAGLQQVYAWVEDEQDISRLVLKVDRAVGVAIRRYNPEKEEKNEQTATSVQK